MANDAQTTTTDPTALLARIDALLAVCEAAKAYFPSHEVLACMRISPAALRATATTPHSADTAGGE